MPVDRVESQGRRVRRLPHDLAVRQKPQFDQRLEAVADTESQSVSLIQKLHNRFFDLRILERRREKFGRTVRLVACGKSAREHDDLRLLNGLFKGIHRFPDIAFA